MRYVLLTIGVVVVLLGIAGVVQPEMLVAIGRLAVTSTGLWVLGAVRVCIGLVVILAAPGSRTPRTLRVLGIVVLIAGLITPLLSVEWTRSILDWEVSLGPAFMRVLAGGVAAVGAFFIYAVSFDSMRGSGTNQISATKT